MLWRMSADLPDKRIGFMGILFLVILSEAKDLVPVARGDEILRFAQDDSGAAPQPATNVSATNVFQSAKTRCANCVNCANPCLSPRFRGPYYGAKEFPVVHGRSCAISCRTPTVAGRSGIGCGWAERAERSETPGTRQLPAALTLRTPIPRLPALCLSGPFRSELSARSADRGRVVPVLDRFSRRSPIAPFAPSFP
jgi:hypothetical protein